MKNSDELEQIVLVKSAEYVNFLAVNRYFLSDSDLRLQFEVAGRGEVAKSGFPSPSSPSGSGAAPLEIGGPVSFA